jgi:outer membrane protein OmpA-like peptidoglycan-associated protein
LTKWSRLAVPYLVVVTLAFVLGVPMQVMAQEEVDPLQLSLTEAKDLLDQGKKIGGKGTLPLKWRDLDGRYNEARKNGATEEDMSTLIYECRQFVHASTFVQEMRQRKSGLEAMLGRFHQALDEIGALYEVQRDPLLAGSEAAADLLDRLDTQNFSRQVLVDSLVVQNRFLAKSFEQNTAAHDSLITSLQVEVSSLRQRLWEAELRVGVAEADRSAAESVLTGKQDYENAIAQVKEFLGSDEGEILLTADGSIVLRVYGIAFGVGSANLQTGQELLVQKLADSIALFPESDVMIEGHTDNTGTRDANLRLSRRRAETVARLLEGQLVWQENSILTEGVGPDRPIANNGTDKGRAHNRRIDVVISPR